MNELHPTAQPQPASLRRQRSAQEFLAGFHAAPRAVQQATRVLLYLHAGHAPTPALAQQLELLEGLVLAAGMRREQLADAVAA